MATITRCAGIPTGTGFLVGDGYSGENSILDDMVQQAAEFLRKHFNQDIEIRFNHNRKSGGAWINDDALGVMFFSHPRENDVYAFGNYAKTPVISITVVSCHLSKITSDLVPRNALESASETFKDFFEQDFKEMKSAFEFVKAHVTAIK